MKNDDSKFPDLWSQCTTDTVLEVRTSKMKKMPGLQIESGIDKQICPGSVRVTLLGLDDDEHDPTFHGGIDKAVHGYCSSHYTDWQHEFPAAADRFRPGGFGENLVTRHLNERNVCIGDKWAVGDSVVLQVSLPRQPCFKLNHRFQLKNFAPKTFRLSRTGWYYRVLKEGNIKAGDRMNLIERKWPTWTIERVQEFLHRNQEDQAMNEELAAIEAMGEESRGAFRKRVAKAKAKAKRSGETEKGEPWREYTVAEKTTQTPRIASFLLKPRVPITEDEQPVPNGAHVKLLLPNGLQRSYSVVSGNAHGFELGIALEESSRGGSRWLHSVAPGQDAVLKVGRFKNDVPNANAASNHVFIAGGVGITAFLASMEAYYAINYNIELHYAVRSTEDVPFRARLEKLGASVKIYDKSKNERMDIDEIVRTLKWNSQLYFCGPTRMIEAGRVAVEAHGVDENEVHYEAFAADATGDPFEAEVANRGGKIVKVAEEETLLEVLKRELGSDQFQRHQLSSPSSSRIRVATSNNLRLFLFTKWKLNNMASTEEAGDGFSILPIQMPALPSCPITAIHEVRVRRNTPKIPTAIDGRSLFLKNVPADASEAHFRAVFGSLVGPGRFESIAFEGERKRRLELDPAQASKMSALVKKRKRDEQEAEERAREEETALLPEVWTRRIHKSGSSAIVLMADEKSVDQVLKAIAKAKRKNKLPVWGEGVADDTPELGSPWVAAHLQLARADKTATQKSVHAFFNVFNRKEKEAAETAKRLRNEPDEDGFVTVTRGGRATPATKNEAEVARQKMVDRAAKKKDETKDFYRFQLRERRKAEQAALLRRFDEDRQKVFAMKEKRGKFRPET
ncbi:hypothetical protein ACHAQA_001754 [Verticillium albo-atrum]